MRIIIDAKYEKSDLKKVMAEQCQHLSTNEQERLLKLLHKFEYLFDDTLVTCKTTPMDLDLKYYAEPVFLLPYPIPRVHKTMFKN